MCFQSFSAESIEKHRVFIAFLQKVLKKNTVFSLLFEMGWAGLSSARLSLARLGSARLGSARLGSARPGPARLGPARLGSARLGSARLGSARTGPAWLGSARFGSVRSFWGSILGSFWGSRISPPSCAPVPTRPRHMSNTNNSCDPSLLWAHVRITGI